MFVEQPRLQRVCLLLIGRSRPVADLFCKVIPWPWPFAKRLAVHHWLYYSRWMRGEDMSGPFDGTTMETQGLT